jgi:hypothetical protein
MVSRRLPIYSVRGSSSKEQTTMEIGPVASIRIAPMIRPREADLGLTDVYEVERSTRTGDEIYIPSGTKAASGFEDDEDKYEELEDEDDSEPRVRPAGISKINRFA